MTNYRAIQLHIDKGRGIAGEKVGEPVKVYRIGLNPDATSIFDSGNLFVNTYCIFRKDPPSKYIENDNLGSLIYELVMNANTLLTGDFILQNDPYYDNNTIYFVSTRRPVAKIVGIRAESLAQVFRPVSLQSGSNYAGIIRNPTQNLPLQLVNGQFAFGSPGGSPTLIPLGLQTQHRIHMDIVSDVPTTTRIAYWFGSLPPLPGIQLREGDWISIYEVDSASPGSIAGVGDPNAGLSALDQVVRGQAQQPTGIKTRQRIFKVHLPYYNAYGLTGYTCMLEDLTVV